MVKPPQPAEVTSLTVTVNEQVPVFPALSVAEHVTVFTPMLKVVPEEGLQVGVMAPSQLSLAVAVNFTTTPVEHEAAFVVIGPGQVTTGFSQSFTVTQNEQVPVFPALSVAEHVTVVFPTLKIEPEAGLQVGVTMPSQMSLADALNVTTALQ
jgi:hypothetical protein